MKKVFWELEQFEDRIALIYENEKSLSYKNLAKECDRFCEAIGNRKSLIWIDVDNRVEVILSYLAALRGNHCVMLMPSSLEREQRLNLLSEYRPDWIWSRTEEGASVFSWGSFKLIPGPTGNLQDIHSDLNLLLTTSGSTGSSKFVRLKRTSVNANAQSISQYLCLTETETAITCLPLHYSYGLSLVHSHLAVGARIVVTEASYVQKEFWDLVRLHSVTSLAGVPYSYEILKKIGFFQMEIPSLRYMTQAGGKLSNELITEFSQFAGQKGIGFFVMYGQTEATARISYLPSEKVLEKLGSIGKVIPGGLLVLQNQEGRTITKPGEEGVLVYKGKNVMMGYAYSRSDLSKQDELKGVLRTGDLARFDDQGYFYITGRESRFIKILGNRVGLDEIETYLKKQGHDVVCAGKDDLLKVVSRSSTSSREIEKAIMDQYRFPKFLFQVVYADQIPLTSSGKPDLARILTL